MAVKLTRTKKRAQHYDLYSVAHDQHITLSISPSDPRPSKYVPYTWTCGTVSTQRYPFELKRTLQQIEGKINQTQEVFPAASPTEGAASLRPLTFQRSQSP